MYYGYDNNDLNIVFPSNVRLGSTPTYTALLVAQRMVPEFKRKNNLEKINIVLMTDGTPDYISRYRVGGTTTNASWVNLRIHHEQYPLHSD